MCTCINLKTKDHYFGRNLDLEYRFYEKVVITPRNYEFKLKKEGNLKTKYAMIGMATVVDNYPLYADATNEKGLSIAALIKLFAEVIACKSPVKCKFISSIGTT